MQSLKIFLKIFVFILVFSLVTKSWHLLTDGFRLDKINSKLIEKEHDSNNFENIKKIFDQKFYYLSRGCQTYVFKSEDDNYVIKFIRYHRYKTPFWMKVYNLNDSYVNKREKYKTKLLCDSINSYNFAYKYLEDETAIVYVHLNKTSFLNKKLEIRDRFNKKHLIDLDTTGFLVQKKVKCFKDVLQKNLNNPVELKRLTLSFLQTTKSIYLKGFNNDDYNCIKNSGVIDNKVIHSDVGSFLQKNLKNKEAFEKEFEHFVIYYKKWAKVNAPFLIGFVDDEIKKMASDL